MSNIQSGTATQNTARVLITGATGAVGTEIVKLFSLHGVAVRALVRNRGRADKIALPGVELVEGDLDTPETLRAALDGVERAFLLTPSSEKAEAQQKTFVREAVASGISHIVKLSQLGASSDSAARFLRYHGEVENAIRQSGLAWTFLRPNLFMQGLLQFKPMIAEQNAFYAPAGDGKVSVVDVRDIAEVAFAALTQPNHEGKTYDITGPQSLTHTEMADQLSQIVGRKINFVNVPPDAMREALLGLDFPVWQADGLLEEYAAWSQNEAAQVANGVFEATGKMPRSFAQFARDYAPEFS